MNERELDTVLRRLAEGRHSLVDRAAARAAGAGRHALRRRLASPDWSQVSDRVMRLAGAPVTDVGRAMAAVLDAGSGAVLSHSSAAALWGLPGFDCLPLHVSRPRSTRGRGPSLARLHHPTVLPTDHCTVHDGVPVTTLARTVCDLAGCERSARLERVLHAALRTGLSWKALEQAVADLAGPGRPGSGVVRELLARHRGRPVLGSGLEARFLDALRAAGLPEPRRQVDVGGDTWVGRVDFLYDDPRLVVEIDGSWCHDGVLDAQRDRRRNAALVAAGFSVLPLAEDLVLHRAEAARLVRHARLSRQRAADRPPA